MAEKEMPFVVNDRRKFNMEGELRDPSAHKEQPVEEAPVAPVEAAATAASEPHPEGLPEIVEDEPALPPPPTEEEIAKVKFAYDQTADRLETMMRASNPGGDHLPPMSFDRLVQSLYMTAMMQLGAGAQPGEQPRVDILGARQSIEMLRVLEEKSVNNVNENETTLIQSALFELRMAFLEITQALARSAQAKQQQQPGGPGMPGGPLGGPKLVR